MGDIGIVICNNAWLRRREPTQLRCEKVFMNVVDVQDIDPCVRANRIYT